MPATRFRFQDFELDQIAYELRRSSQPVRLERIPFELLSLLIERHGQLVSRDDIIERVWGKGVFHDTEHGINTAIRKIRLALQDDSESPRFIATVPAKGYRFVAPVEQTPCSDAIEPRADPTTPSNPPAVAAPRSKNRAALFISAAVVLGVIAVYAFFHFHRAEALAETDTILVADFSNTTGDPVFDDSLKEALSVELAQSPFLNLVSPRQVQQTLAMMKASPDTRLTADIARQVCQRSNGAAILQGSIAQIGTQYDLILKAVSCSEGQLLASAESQAADKNHVLSALDKASSTIRQKLGESLITVQKFDRPLAQATTPSLDALKAFSLGNAKFEKGDQAAAIPFFQRAIELDPDFAMAYLGIGRSYSVLGEYPRVAEPIQKAFALRHHASEREQFEITAVYHQHVTLQTDQAIQNCELWEQSYPRDLAPHRILGFENGALANYDRSASEFRKAMQLEPKQSLPYAGLMSDLMAMNRFAEARRVFQEARAQGVQAGEVERIGYELAFVERDTQAMNALAAALSTEPGYEARVLMEQSNTAAYFGRLREARELARRSEEMSLSQKDTGTASNIESDLALREAFFGNPAVARAHAALAVKLGSPPEDYAMALAVAADPVLASKVVEQIARETPPGSFIAKESLGEFRGAIALHQGNTARALNDLASAEPFEAGWFEVYRPTYVRGQAYLVAHRGSEAAAEFQKILDHPGVVINLSWASLAHLGLARAYAQQHDLPKARAAYQDFLSLWNDADADIPIFKQAQSEFAALR